MGMFNSSFETHRCAMLLRMRTESEFDSANKKPAVIGDGRLGLGARICGHTLRNAY
jgi:hypothetical protein